MNRPITSVVLAILLCLSWLTTQPLQASRPSTQPDLAAIDAYVESQMKAIGLPGLALGIVQGDRIVHLRGFGVADPTGRPVTPQTPFMLASVSKPMTALAVMQLVDRGLIALDEPVQTYVPWFRVADEQASAQITVRQLLYHTSGLSQATGIEAAGREDLAPAAIELDVRGLQDVQLAHPVGTTYEYSNPNYQILGLIIEQVTGQPYASYMQANVFDPLEMTQAFTSRVDAEGHGLADGYRHWFGLRVPYSEPFDNGGLPSGYLMASAEDVAHFLIPHLNGGAYGDTVLLSAPSMAELLRPAGHKPVGDESFAMDWGVMDFAGETMIIKGGDLAAFKTQMVLVPNERWGVVTLINTNDRLGSFLGDARIPFIPLGVTQMLLGQEPGQAPTSPLPVVFRGVPVLILGLQLAGILALLNTLRRWNVPNGRPARGWATAWRIAMPVVGYLLLALLAVPGVTGFFGMPLSFLLYMFPDFGYPLLAISLIGVGWGLIWAIWSVYTLRQETPVPHPSTHQPVPKTSLRSRLS